MTVRHSLLAILAEGSCYGYQLRQEFLRRTGGAWPLNVGQVYATLDRLERDALVEKRGTDAEGHVLYATTAAGSAAAASWLSTPVVREDRDELAVKLALAASLPGADAGALIAAQRALPAPGPVANPVIEAWRAAVLEAERRWLEVCESLAAGSYAIDTAAPKRGRPARTPQ